MATYQTAVPGTTITAAWGNNVRDGLITDFANAAARTSAVPAPPDAMVTMLKDAPKRFEFYDATLGLWRGLGGYIECTSGTRPPNPREGQRIRETDTNFDYRHNGTKWIRDDQKILMTAVQSWVSNATYGFVLAGNTSPNGGMTFPMDVGSKYEFELDLHVQAASGAALGVQIIYPTGSNADTAYIGTNNTGAFVSGGTQGIASGAAVGIFGGTGGTSLTKIHGQVTTGGNAGSLSLAFAQGTSNPSGSFVLVGTTLKYRQVA